MRTRLALSAAVLLAVTALPAQAAAPADAHVEGRLPSGAAYVMDVPAGWNGTVLLYSHGYTPSGSPNPARNAPDADTRGKLLAAGYALIGSSYATSGWALTEAVPDQLATLDLFTERDGTARRTLAWGTSYGGLVTTALAERHGDRFDGSLSMCGLVQGGVANWNSTLDPVFALRTLLAPGSGVRLTGFTGQGDARAASDTLTAATDAAQRTPEGRARIALAAALHNIPGYNSPTQTEPGPTDWAGRQANQYAAVRGLLQQPAFGWRQEAESRAGGTGRGRDPGSSCGASRGAVESVVRVDRRSRADRRRWHRGQARGEARQQDGLQPDPLLPAQIAHQLRWPVARVLVVALLRGDRKELVAVGLACVVHRLTERPVQRLGQSVHARP
ncbi:alpha/beta hydrolase family protein [Streptomyces sp. HO565]|uniref:alpha/beta hydrolase family protein n=1 Tax=Streptomyces sp. HO565 TaxID=2857489 RepID=UPI0038B44208